MVTNERDLTETEIENNEEIRMQRAKEWHQGLSESILSQIENPEELIKGLIKHPIYLDALEDEADLRHDQLKTTNDPEHKSLIKQRELHRIQMIQRLLKLESEESKKEGTA